MKMYLVTGTILAKLSAIFISFLGFGKMSSRRKCKISTAYDPRIALKIQKARKLSFSDPEMHRRRPGTIDSVSSPQNDVWVVAQHDDYDHQKALSLKDLGHSIELEEGDAVPDAVEYQVPFGSEIGEEPMNDRINDLEKQLICSIQELQDEMRREIKSIEEKLKAGLEKIEKLNK